MNTINLFKTKWALRLFETDPSCSRDFSASENALFLLFPRSRMESDPEQMLSRSLLTEQINVYITERKRYQSSDAAVTNPHKLRGLKQHKYILLHYRGWKSDIDLTRLKSKCRYGCVPSGSSGGKYFLAFPASGGCHIPLPMVLLPIPVDSDPPIFLS